MVFYVLLTLISLITGLTLISIFRWIRINKLLHSKIQLDQGISDEVKTQINFDSIDLAELNLIDIFFTSLKLNIHSLDKYGNVNLKGKVIDTFDNLQDLLSQSINHSTEEHTDSLNDDMLFYEPIESSLFVEDFSTENSSRSTGAADLIDDFALKNLAGKIPVIALATRTFKDFKKYDNLEIEEEVLVTNLAVNSVVLTAASAKGLAIGTKLGAYFAAPTGGASLILGPLFGALGIAGGSWISRKFKKWWYGQDYRNAKEKYDEAKSDFYDSLEDLANAYKNNYPELRRRLFERHRENLEILTEKIKTRESFLKRLIFPSLITVVLIKKRKEIKKTYSEVTVPYYEKIIHKINEEGYFPSNSGEYIFLQGENKFFGISAITKKFKVIRSRIKKLKKALSKLNMETKELNKKL